MKTITKWIIAVTVANLLLLPATLTPPSRAAAEVDSAAAAPLFDCCSESFARTSYCCKQCCWFRAGCHRCGAELAFRPEQDTP